MSEELGFIIKVIAPDNSRELAKMTVVDEGRDFVASASIDAWRIACHRGQWNEMRLCVERRAGIEVMRDMDGDIFGILDDGVLLDRFEETYHRRTPAAQLDQAVIVAVEAMQ